MGRHQPGAPRSAPVTTPCCRTVAHGGRAPAPNARRAFAVAGVLIPVWFAGAAGAEEPGQGPCIVDCEDTRVMLGVGGAFMPEFEGAEDNEFRPVPIVSIQNFYGFNLSVDGLSYTLVEMGGRPQGWTFTAGPLVGLADSRDQDDSDALDGLGDVDFGVDLGLFSRATYGPVMLDLTVTQEVADGHGGLLATVGAGTRVPVTDRLSLAPRVSTTWADDSYMDSFFGVDAGQSAASGLDAFDAGAGFKDISIQLGSSYRLTESIALRGSLGYSRLVGDAADSPIVRDNGSADQFRALLGISYQFSF